MKYILIPLLLWSTICFGEVLSSRLDDERLEDRRRVHEQVLWERDFVYYKTKFDSYTKIETSKYNKNVTVNINGEK